ncbi:hypothetical protein [Aureivirga sp. CE67]|uniref:hypothetical protein n=1 Tax=Aureivirga sp. CE67 TaxID=1788983 RepID=UPI0018C90996|nr:hypothetical protein [Aureivirga sp. CE67]
MSTNHNPEEEVELSKLLGVIGKGISNFIKGIGRFFSKIFHVFILTIIFLKKYALYFIGSILIGIGVGYFVKKYEGELYFYEMEIKPNYDSEVYIADKINNINIQLAFKNYEELNKILELSAEDLKKIKNIELIPIHYLKDKVLEYEEFIKNNDTIVSKLVTFKDFQSQSFSKYSSKRYNIDIVVHEPISKNFQEQLISYFSENSKFKLARNFKIKNLDLEEETIKKGLADIDSLRLTNRLVALKSAEHITTLGSDIDIVNSNDRKENEVDQRNTTEDQNLYSTAEDLIKKLNTVSEQKLKYQEIIRVISDLNFKGVYTKSVTSDPIKLFGILSFVLALAVILLLKFNTYLKNYKK